MEREGGGGTEEAAGQSLADSVDSHFGDALLVEGSVDPERYVHGVGRAEVNHRVVAQLETPSVNSRQGQLFLWGGLGPLLLFWTVVHCSRLRAAATMAYVLSWVGGWAPSEPPQGGRRGGKLQAGSAGQLSVLSEGMMPASAAGLGGAGGGGAGGALQSRGRGWSCMATSTGRLCWPVRCSPAHTAQRASRKHWAVMCPHPQQQPHTTSGLTPSNAFTSLRWSRSDPMLSEAAESFPPMAVKVTDEATAVPSLNRDLTVKPPNCEGGLPPRFCFVSVAPGCPSGGNRYWTQDVETFAHLLMDRR